MRGLFPFGRDGLVSLISVSLFAPMIPAAGPALAQNGSAAPTCGTVEQTLTGSCESKQ